MVLGGVAFGRCLDHESGALMNGINALIKQTPPPSRALLPLLLCEDTMRSLGPGKWLSPNHVGTLTQISSLQNYEK